MHREAALGAALEVERPAPPQGVAVLAEREEVGHDGLLSVAAGGCEEEEEEELAHIDKSLCVRESVLATS